MNVTVQSLFCIKHNTAVHTVTTNNIESMSYIVVVLFKEFANVFLFFNKVCKTPVVQIFWATEVCTFKIHL